MSGAAYSDEAGVFVDIRDGTALVRIDRPAERNALSADAILALENALSSISSRADLSAIVFTGSRGVFAAGADIRELRGLTRDGAGDFARRGQQLMAKIESAPQMTVAAIDGFCMGGGLDLALACRARCASARSIFAHPGARLGIITGWGGTQRLPRLIGTAVALELFVTARRMTSSEALAVGLIDRIGDPVVECALEMIRSLPKRS